MDSRRTISQDDRTEAAPSTLRARLCTPDLRDAIREHGRAQGSKVFLRSLDQGKEVSYGELARYCNRVSAYLGERGLGRSDWISVLGRNSVETLLAYLGVLYHGSVVNPINADESQENIYKILGLVRPQLLLHDGGLRIDGNRTDGTRAVPFRRCDAPPGSADDDFYSALPVEGPGGEAGVSVGADDLAEIVFTSGTTSIPKGVCIARGPLHAMVAEVVEKIGITREDVLLEYRNYNWASAQLLTILSSVLTGATLLLARRFSRSRFAAWLTEGGVTVAAGVPTVINILAQEPVCLPEDGRIGLRFMTSSSAPLSVADQRAFERIYGVPVLQMAGMTEAGFMLGSPFHSRRSGSAGTPCRYKEVFFVNSAGERCARGEEGEMVVRGYSMGAGYLQDSGEVEPFPAEGFRTGDLGHMDGEGFVYITGRVKDLIIRGGVNIAPAEITACLMDHPMIREATTIGVPDRIYGEEVASFVVPKNGSILDPDQVIDHCRRMLPEFKVPKRVFALDRIPKTARGKIAKEDLLAIFEAAGSQKTGQTPREASRCEPTGRTQ